MLGLEFEEFEIISSRHELWILESREVVFDECTLNKLRKKFDDSLNSYFDEIIPNFDDGYLILDNVNEGYGNFLLNYLIESVIKLN